MTSLDAAPAQQGQMTPGAQPVAAEAGRTMAPSGAPAGGAAPGGLPPTGLQQQLQSMNDYYANVQQAQGPGGSVGFDVNQQQFQQGAAGLPSAQQLQPGGSNLEALAQNLAERYGLPVGRGKLVDERGNLLVTPDQLAAASGGAETMGSAAAKLNYISQAVAREQSTQAQQKGISAIQAGMGQVQKRGRGSLATMMSGMYQDLADLYSNQEFEAADFSYFIQKEKMDIAQDLQRRAEKQAKKRSRMGFITGIIGLGLAPFTGGASLAMAGGIAQAGDTGWF